MILLPCLMRIKNIKNRGGFFTGPRLFYLEKHVYKMQYNSSFRTTSENLALLEWHWQIWLVNTMFLILFQYSFEDDLLHALLLPLEQELQKTQHTYCGRIYKVFIKQLTKSIRDLSIRRTKERWLLQVLLSILSYWTDHFSRIFDAWRSFLKKWCALVCCYLKSALSSIEDKIKIVIILGNYKLWNMTFVPDFYGFILNYSLQNFSLLSRDLWSWINTHYCSELGAIYLYSGLLFIIQLLINLKRIINMKAFMF